MKLNFITFMVRDLDRSVEFFTNAAGLQIVRTMENPFGRFAFLAEEEGAPMLELIESDKAETFQAVGLTVAFSGYGDLEAARQKVLDLGYEPGEIMDQGTAPVHFKVIEPSGIEVEFLQ